MDGAPAGFCAVDHEGYLLQLFLEREEEPASGRIMVALVVGLGLRGAYAATIDPAFLSLCLDRQSAVTVDTLLYFDHHIVPPASAGRLRPATLDDLASLARIQWADEEADTQTMGAAFGGPEGYLRATVEQGVVHVLEDGGSIVGCGELRRRETWPGTADLGVIVAPEHQGRGVGTEILCLLKQMAADSGLQPMCSTTVENVASQRMIAKTGMVARHRILKVDF